MTSPSFRLSAEPFRATILMPSGFSLCSVLIKASARAYGLPFLSCLCSMKVMLPDGYSGKMGYASAQSLADFIGKLKGWIDSRFRRDVVEACEKAFRSGEIRVRRLPMVTDQSPA